MNGGNGLFNTLNYELLNKKDNIIINVFHVLTKSLQLRRQTIFFLSLNILLISDVLCI